MKNIIHLGREETRDGSTVDYLFDKSTGKFYAKIFTFAIGSNNSNRTTELKVNTIEDLKSKLKNKNIKWTSDAITTFPELKENMKKQIKESLDLTIQEYDFLCQMADIKHDEEEGISYEVLDSNEIRLANKLKSNGYIRINSNDLLKITSKGKKAIADYDDEEWVDPAGGTHRGRDVDPARKYESKQFSLAQTVKKILKENSNEVDQLFKFLDHPWQEDGEIEFVSLLDQNRGNFKTSNWAATLRYLRSMDKANSNLSMMASDKFLTMWDDLIK